MIQVLLKSSSLEYQKELHTERLKDGTLVYVAEIPGLPGCMTHGVTEAEALANLEDAKIEYLSALEEFGISGPSAIWHVCRERATTEILQTPPPVRTLNVPVLHAS